MHFVYMGKIKHILPDWERQQNIAGNEDGKINSNIATKIEGVESVANLKGYQKINTHNIPDPITQIYLLSIYSERHRSIVLYFISHFIINK